MDYFFLEYRPLEVDSVDFLLLFSGDGVGFEVVDMRTYFLHLRLAYLLNNPNILMQMFTNISILLKLLYILIGHLNYPLHFLFLHPNLLQRLINIDKRPLIPIRPKQNRQNLPVLEAKLLADTFVKNKEFLFFLIVDQCLAVVTYFL